MGSDEMENGAEFDMPQTRNDLVKQKLIDWFDYNMKSQSISKNNLALYCKVSRQAVHKWTTQGLISKENLILCARYFRTIPPLDLISDNKEKTIVSTREPLDYDWSHEARNLVKWLKEVDKKRDRNIYLSAIKSLINSIENIDKSIKENRQQNQNVLWECNTKTRSTTAELYEKLQEDESISITLKYPGDLVLGEVAIAQGEKEKSKFSIYSLPRFSMTDIDKYIEILSGLVLTKGIGDLIILRDKRCSPESVKEFNRYIKNTKFTMIEEDKLIPHIIKIKHK